VLKLFLFNDIFSSKLIKEKRKYARAKYLLPAEIIDSEGKSIFTGRAKVKDFSDEGLKLSLNFSKLKPGSTLDLKIYLPEKKIITFVSAEVTWNKYTTDSLELGLKIKDIDKDVKEEILSWIFPSWLKTELAPKKKKAKKTKTKKKK
jgi:hypothetical protein